MFLKAKDIHTNTTGSYYTITRHTHTHTHMLPASLKASGAAPLRLFLRTKDGHTNTTGNYYTFTALPDKPTHYLYHQKQQGQPHTCF